MSRSIALPILNLAGFKAFSYIYEDFNSHFMKRILPVLVLVFCFAVSISQTVYKDYTDGRLYVKCSRALLAPVSNANPRNIPLQGLGFIQDLLTKYGISRISKPFYQADDDPLLPYILKLE